MMKLRIFFWFHHKSGQFFGVISIYFSFFKVNVHNWTFFGGGGEGGANFQINFGYA